jgi:hypothetical protein
VTEHVRGLVEDHIDSLCCGLRTPCANDRTTGLAVAGCFAITASVAALRFGWHLDSPLASQPCWPGPGAISSDRYDQRASRRCAGRARDDVRKTMALPTSRSLEIMTAATSLADASARWRDATIHPLRFTRSGRNPESRRDQSRSKTACVRTAGTKPWRHDWCMVLRMTSTNAPPARNGCTAALCKDSAGMARVAVPLKRATPKGEAWAFARLRKNSATKPPPTQVNLRS